MKKRISRRSKKKVSTHSGEETQPVSPPNLETPEGIINGDPMLAAAWNLAMNTMATATAGKTAAEEMLRENRESSEKKKTAAVPEKKKRMKKKTAKMKTAKKEKEKSGIKNGILGFFRKLL